MFRVIVFLLSLLLTGCTTFFSSSLIIDPDDKNADAIGISYNLPRAVIGVRLLGVPDNAQLLLCVREAIAVADPQQQYFMQFLNSPFSADQFVVKRDERLGTLQEIDIKAQDQFDQFAINLGASAGAVSAPRFQASLTTTCSAPPDNTFELADIQFDPVKPDEVAQSTKILNHVAMTFLEERLRECRLGKLAPAFKAHACREYKLMNRRFRATRDPVRIVWDIPKVPRRVARARCEVGFCYRHTLPHTMHLSVGGNTAYSHTFQIPNSSPIVGLDLTRAIAVTKTTKVTFGRMGEITQIDVKKGQGDATTGIVTDGAEAVELALLPQQVVNAYFSSLKGTTDIIASMFTSQTTAVNNRKQLVDAEVALINARKGVHGSLALQSKPETTTGFVLGASNAVPLGQSAAAELRTEDTKGTRNETKPDVTKEQETKPQGGKDPQDATGPGPGGVLPKK